MLTPRFVAGMISIAMMVPGAGIVSAQDYPNRPIRIITGAITGAAGLATRFVAQGLSGPLGQQIVADSRGSGAIQGDTVGKAAPDGYTLLVSGGSFWVAPLMQKMPYDPVKDFVPVSLLARAPQILVVHPALPVKSVKELIALAKAKPGELNDSIGGVGGTGHLTVELFKSMAGVNIVAVPYSSSSQELTDLLSGRIHMTFTTPASIMEQVKLGKMRALAVTTAEPSVLVPDLPTVASSGLPGYEAVLQIAMFAPARTPESVINRLHQEIVKFLRTSEAKEQFLNSGIEIVASSPGELAAIMKSEMTRLGKVIKDAGIKVE